MLVPKLVGMFNTYKNRKVKVIAHGGAIDMAVQVVEATKRRYRVLNKIIGCVFKVQASIFASRFIQY